MVNINIMWHLLISTLFFFSLPAASEESIPQILTLYDSNLNSNNDHLHLLAISVNPENLREISKSVLNAEFWLRKWVLSYYPTTPFTHIVVGYPLLCSNPNFSLLLPSLKNLFHSLSRYGLEGEIIVSASLSSHCFHSSFSGLYEISEFVKAKNLTFLVNPEEFPIKSHREIERLVHSHVGQVKFIVKSENEPKPTGRKLSFVRDAVPNAVGQPPLPPLVGSLPFPPRRSPVVFPATPPPYGLPHHHHHHFHLPPCNPSMGGAPAPVGSGGAEENEWCVAKPSVPIETLQEAIDYACAEGEADCTEIQPEGSCYYPDTVVAHASYAYNSYWQKFKKNGGTCGFGGTAMIINSDPSYLDCKFIVS